RHRSARCAQGADPSRSFPPHLVIVHQFYLLWLCVIEGRQPLTMCRRPSSRSADAASRCAGEIDAGGEAAAAVQAVTVGDAPPGVSVGVDGPSPPATTR